VLVDPENNLGADDPDVGVGTVIGAGVVNVLGGTGTFENLLTGQTSVNLAVTDACQASALAIAAGAAHTVHLNAADGWASSGENAMSATGVITIDWTYLEA